MSRARLALLCALALAGCDRVPPEDPTLESELELQLTAAAQVAGRFGQLADAPENYSALTGIREAERPLRQHHTACTTRRSDGARVLLVDGRGPIVDGPTQGPWFDYAWKRAGC